MFETLGNLRDVQDDTALGFEEEVNFFGNLIGLDILRNSVPPAVPYKCKWDVQHTW